jgi:Streptomyces sporulation and cell division protein, SsgA
MMTEYPMHSQDVTLTLVSSPKAPPVAATFYWNSEDPLVAAVMIGDSRRIWEFALSLLEDALAHPGTPAGLGDVRVWAGPSDGLLWLAVSSPSGKAVLTCPVDPVCRFVSNVHAKNDGCAEVVARQTEWFLRELDGEIQW